MSKEDRPTFTEGSPDRRIVHLDGTSLASNQAQHHDPERGTGEHRAATILCLDTGGPHWAMSSVYEACGKEHVEGECAGPAKGHA